MENNNDKSVYIEGLPYSYTKEELEKYFEDCGKVIKINMPKYQDSGKILGYAHVFFSTEEEIDKALEKNGQYIGQRYIKVEKSKGKNKDKLQRKADCEAVPSSCHTIFVKNLAYEITEDEIGLFFKPCGIIKSIRLVYNSVYKHFKGFCYVQFEENESVKKALRLNGKLLKGREVIIDFEESGPRKGYHFHSKEPSKFNKELKELHNKTLKKKRKRNTNNN